MSKTVFIYSTLANDNRYVTYVKGGGDVPSVETEVLVKGGAGVANKRADTLAGFVTEVTEEEAKLLANNVVFQRHVKNGFIFISDTKVDPEQAAADMTGRDTSAPLVDADFEAAGQTAPTHTGKGNKPSGRR